MQEFVLVRFLKTNLGRSFRFKRVVQLPGTHRSTTVSSLPTVMFLSSDALYFVKVAASLF